MNASLAPQRIPQSSPSNDLALALRGAPGRPSRIWLGIAGLLVGSSASMAQSLPQGASVAHGHVDVVAADPTRMRITQNDRFGIVDWQSFSIGKAARVDIVQPDAKAVLVNRVVGDTPSMLAGALRANGAVVLVNPNGINIAADGVIEAAGFAASTQDIDAAPFDELLGGRLPRTGGTGLHRPVAAAGIVNLGNIRVGDAGAMLLAPVIQHGGRIEATGNVDLIAQQRAPQVSPSDPVTPLAEDQGEPEYGTESRRESWLGPREGTTKALAAADAAGACATASDVDADAKASSADAKVSPADAKVSSVDAKVSSVDAKASPADADVMARSGDADVAIDVSGVICRRASEPEIGGVFLSAAGGTLTIDGWVDTRSTTTGTGSDMLLMARRIDMRGRALDASGPDGGGEIVLRTVGAHDPTEPAALASAMRGNVDGDHRITVGRDSIIRSSAVIGGPGGQIRLVSSGAMRFDGIAVAIGASPDAGDDAEKASAVLSQVNDPWRHPPEFSGGGGLVLIEGADHLTVGGYIDVSPARGGLPGDVRLNSHSPVTVGDLARAERTGMPATGVIDAAVLSRALNTGNVTVTASDALWRPGDGDITVARPLSWLADTQMSLRAAGAIHVDAAIDAKGDRASIALRHGANDTFTLTDAHIALPGADSQFAVGDQSYQLIRDAAALRAGMHLPLARHYALAGPIDLEGQAFEPLAGSNAEGEPLRHLEGLGHTVSGLNIDRPGDVDVGLFRTLEQQAVVSHLALAGARVIGGERVGAVAGTMRGGSQAIRVSLHDVRVGGHTVPTPHASTEESRVPAAQWSRAIGGMVGDLNGGSTIEYAVADVSVDGQQQVGGLVGTMGEGSAILDAKVEGTVFGETRVGGLAGSVESARIADSIWRGSVIGYGQAQVNAAIGGVAGTLHDGVVIRSRTFGDVRGNDRVGGLVGWMAGHAEVRYCSALANVLGRERVGMLVGDTLGAPVVAANYSGGVVYGTRAPVSLNGKLGASGVASGNVRIGL